MICSKCGKDNKNGEKFCIQCGSKLEQKIELAKEDKPIVNAGLEKGFTELTEDELTKVNLEDDNPNDEEENDTIDITEEQIKNAKCTLICTNCGVGNAVGSKFCSECGKPFPTMKEKVSEESKPTEIRCNRCGTKNKPNAKFCVSCGNDLGNNTTTVNTVSDKAKESLNKSKELMSTSVNKSKEFINENKEKFSVNEITKSSNKARIFTILGCALVVLIGIIVVAVNHHSKGVQFCSSIVNGKPIGVAKSFTPGVVELYVDNGSKIKTSEVKFIFYRGKDGTERVVDSEVKTADPNWTSFHIQYTFVEPDDYRVQILNNKTGDIIAEGNVNIHY